MPTVVVAEEEIAGTPVIIQASHRGSWYISRKDDDGTTLGSGDTLEQAKQQARTELAKRKVKVNVAFITEGGERCVATGIHVRNRTILVRDSEGQSYQESNYRKVLSPETPQEEVDRLLKAQEQAREATRTQNEIIATYSIDLRQEVDRAINEAVEAQS